MQFGILYLVSFIISLILIGLLVRTGKSEISKLLMRLTLLVCFWIFMETLSFFVPVWWILLFQKLKYIGVILVPPTLLITVIIFIKKYTQLNLIKKGMIYFIPVLSLLSVLTIWFPYPFLSHPEIYFLGDIPMYTYTKNIGFYINASYSYLATLITSYLLFVRAIKSPKIYRMQSIFVCLGCTTTFVINVLFITQTFVLVNIDTTPIFILVTLIVFYWGVFQLPKSMIIPYARDLVIENMRDLVIIVDNFKCIIDVNPIALRMIQQHADEEQKKSLTRTKLIGMNILDLLNYIPQVKDIQPLMEKKEDKILVIQNDTNKNYYSLNQEDFLIPMG